MGSTKKINRRYIWGILITAGVLFANQIFIQYWLAQKKYDANTINLTGRQRMLSQHINLELYKIKYNGANFQQVNELFELWKNTHYSLLNNPEKLGSIPIEQEEALQLMHLLSPKIDFINTQLIAQAIPEDEILAKIDENQAIFLVDMDRVVKLLEQESEQKLNFIVWTEIVLMLLSLLIITLEVRFIYIPIQDELEESYNVLKVNRQLQASVDTVTRKNKEMEQFTYIASHDLQEPLRTVSNFSDYIMDNYGQNLDEIGHQSIQFIQEATERMQQLIKGLLDYSQIGSKAEQNLVDCNQLLKNIQSDLSAVISDTNASFQLSLLPEIEAYEIELRLLFQNLISNAIKFRKINTAPKVSIWAEEQEEYWKFAVQDNGIGIADKHKEKIFVIFQRLHDRETYEGTGIGLAHCRKIVELHGGKIFIDSEFHEGSIFYFTIKKDIHETAA